ncbi:DoxX family protein [Poseidonibacter lekithochrous]|uniref:HvfX family Cu-binding RiPP maturation protein n=1 Tax=Poseidonibacter lekithochrous TaxID=1904463 RepID=UPI0008FCAAD5|nr:DoxX family protein [Poseidonibacter lekithochrous]QKJ23932.1 DoxX family protein [Poseidonibacter lekithochrous]
MTAKIYNELCGLFDNLQSIFLLIARLVVAYGFYEPALMKWNDINSVASWFATLGIPFPTLSAYLASTAELLGVVLIAIGFLTRIMSIPLMIVMVVAILTVHIGNGFSAGDNGFEIPLYYLIFLGLFLSNGAGKFSVDYLIFKK